MVNLKEFVSAIDQIAEEKGVSREAVTDVIEQALAAAYKKDYGERGENIRAVLDSETGTAEFFQVFLVVDDEMILSEEEVAELERQREKERKNDEEEEGAEADEQDMEDEVDDSEDDDEEEEETEEEEGEGEEGKEDEKEEDDDEQDKQNDEDEEEEKKVRFNPKRHKMLDEARDINKDVEPGDEVLVPLETKEEFGRIAAQTAKQVIIQRIREAERAVVYETFKEKEGEIVSGTVQRIERGVVYLDIGRTVGMLFPEEQIPHERYRIGQRVRVYVVRVEKDSRGPSIVLSRRHPNIITRLFELEVPEVASGVVEIKAIAREVGSRAKIAVTSHEEGIDAVGSCVGQKGIRVSAVINELGGENIDIIEWDEDPTTFIAHALSPAKVLNVALNEEERTATVDVREDQLSLAIGKRGQNVRLAAKLTGWKIDVQGAEKVLEDEGVSEDDLKAEVEEAAEKGDDISSDETADDDEKAEEDVATDEASDEQDEEEAPDEESEKESDENKDTQEAEKDNKE